MAEKKVNGNVDRIEGDVAVVVIRDPKNSGATKEIYLPKNQVNNGKAKEGDPVTVVIKE
ncbi:MAG: hypothetical protein HQM10_25480 [Candidatus Riflebacteria bacterium]|nr:hypothetical protein [Candidatus Riflebacteria bacterium]